MAENDINEVVREALAIDREDRATCIENTLDRLCGHLKSDLLPRLLVSVDKRYPDELLALQAYHTCVRIRTLIETATHD